MRSTWKGAITFGLVSIPVQLFPATEEHGVPLHQVHEKDAGRIRYKRYCEKENHEVAYSDIAKAYESPDGRVAILTEEDLANLPLPSKKIIDVLAFVDAAEVDPVMLSKPYYLQTASPAAAKPYVLLREALAATGRAAVTKITLRTRESLALLRVRDDLLILQTMLWPDEVRPATGLAPQGHVEVRPQELKMATSLMDTLSEDFDLSELHDEYQEALDTLVEAKLEGAEPQAEEEAPAAPENVIDLMAALTASVKAAEESRAAGNGKKTAARTAGKDTGKQQPAAGKKAASGRGTTAKTTRKTAEKTAQKTAQKKTAATRRRASA